MDYGRESADHHYGHMIQAFHRFFVDNMSLEGNTYPHNPWLLPPPSDSNEPATAPITQLFGVDAKNVIVCTNCKAVREKEHMTHVIDLAYPRAVRYSNVSRCHVLRLCRTLRTILHKEPILLPSSGIPFCDNRRTKRRARTATSNSLHSNQHDQLPRANSHLSLH